MKQNHFLSVMTASTAAILMLSLAPVSQAQTSQYSNSMTSRDYMITNFDRLTVRGPIKVVLETGKPGKILAKGSQNAIDSLIVTRNSSALELSLNATQATASQAMKNSGPMTVYLSTADVENLVIFGAGDVSINKLGSYRMQINMSGSGRLNVAEMSVRNLDIGMIGSPYLTIGGGKSENATIAMDGAPTLNAPAYNAERLKLTVSGPANVEMSASKEAAITNNGTGNLLVTGKASCTVTGGGTANIVCNGRRW